MKGQLRLQAGILVAIGVLSHAGDGWGHFVVYAFLLLSVAVIMGATWVVLRVRGASAPRRSETLTRILRSFALATGVVVVGLVLTRIVVRLGDHPIGSFPGGELRGVLVTEPVDDWSFLQGEEEIELQIPKDPLFGAPYSITVHFTVHRRQLYVGADFVFPFKQWVHTMAKDDRVLVGSGGSLYPRRAVRVTDEAEHSAVLTEAARRVRADPDDFLTEVWFFRMEPRR